MICSWLLVVGVICMSPMIMVVLGAGGHGGCGDGGGGVMVVLRVMVL